MWGQQKERIVIEMITDQLGRFNQLKIERLHSIFPPVMIIDFSFNFGLQIRIQGVDVLNRGGRPHLTAIECERRQSE